jgi:hypothetical protein
VGGPITSIKVKPDPIRVIIGSGKTIKGIVDQTSAGRELCGFLQGEMLAPFRAC